MKILYQNFIEKIINKDLKKKRFKKICTRFSPEPNGFLHLGHAKSIYLNFNLSKKYKGCFNLRFDDTNPEKESINYINSIKKDIKWLGYRFKLKYTSNYFKKIYKYAKQLIKKNLAYVDKLNNKEIKIYRGDFLKKGFNSPYRNRSIKKNLFLFKNMKNFLYKENKYCLRAKINMLSCNILMRDPIIYRIKYHIHHNTKNNWCIYPTYDFAHCISDYIEKITHSLCTLEFENNKFLYRWILNNLDFIKYPNQYEFSRLNLKYNILSKRKINLLIKNKIVKNWKDPRLLTISGLRNRGYTPKSIKNFCKNIGITKKNSSIEFSLLEKSIRNDLCNVQRSMAVLNPIKLVIENLPKNYIKILLPFKNPLDKSKGNRKLYFSKNIYIDKKDFKISANKNYRRLILGKEVRLRYSFIIKANNIIRNKLGKIKYISCTCDLNTLNLNPSNRKVKGVIHWVSIKHSLKAKFYIYKNLFLKKKFKKDFIKYVNKKSLVIKNGFIEFNFKKKKYIQFEREGYFIYKKKKSYKNNKNIFYRILNLKKRYKKNV